MMYLSAAILPHKIMIFFYVTVLNLLLFPLADIQKGTNYIPVLILGLLMKFTEFIKALQGATWQG